MLRHLSASHHVTYLSYYEGNRDLDYEQEIAREIPGTVPLPTGRTTQTGLNRYLNYLGSLPRTMPYAVSRFFAQPVRQTVSEWLGSGRFDVAICDFLASTPNFPVVLPTPTVLFQHNVETVLWHRRAQCGNLVDRLTARVEARKMARYEGSQVRRFHRVVTVSEQDCRATVALAGSLRISVVPTGVDLASYRYDPELCPSEPLVMFTGSMDWQPNIDGVEYFCREIWPLVLGRVPQARFRIVGRNPVPRVRRLSSDSVEVTGTVPSIVDQLREAAVVVVPLRVGGGTRIKIYEAMAMGKAIVSTSVGAEGLDVRHEDDVLLANDAETFSGYVVRLLSDRTLRRRYESAAAITAKQYDWSAVTAQFVRILEEVVCSSTIVSRS